jgi:hypothetical protein
MYRSRGYLKMGVSVVIGFVNGLRIAAIWRVCLCVAVEVGVVEGGDS